MLYCSVQPLRQSTASRVRQQPATETASQRPPRRFVKKFKVVGNDTIITDMRFVMAIVFKKKKTIWN